MAFKSKKGIVALATSLTLLFSGSISNGLAMEPPGKYNPYYWEDFPEGKSRYMVFDDLGQYRLGSALGPALEPLPCSGAYPANCTMDSWPNLSGRYLLDSCDDNTDPVCLETMSMKIGLGKKVEGAFQYFYVSPYGEGHSDKQQPSNYALGIPRGEMMSIWKFPGMTHSGGSDLYILKFELSFVGCQKPEWSFCDYMKPMFNSLKFNLVPFSLYKFSGYQDGGLMPANAQHQWMSGVVESYPEGATVEVTVRAPQAIGRWVRARASNVSVSLEQIDSDSVRLTVSGDPVLVPGLTVVTDPITNPWGRVEQAGSYGGNPSQMYLAEALRPAANDTATGELRIFNFETMESPSGNSNLYQKCLASSGGFGGFVASNSMFYEAAAPQYKDGYLSYRIAGMHYLSDGSVAKGNFEMYLNKTFASCLYGVEKISPSAQVSVINEMGSQEVATVVTRESGDWIQLIASNFTFSTKEVRVLLEGAASSESSGDMPGSRPSQVARFVPVQKTLATFEANTTVLSSLQKTQIRSVVEANPTATKFICTGIRYYDQPMSVNIMVRKRAKAACEYAKQLNPELSTWYQNKPTKARSYAGKVLLTLKVPSN